MVSVSTRPINRALIIQDICQIKDKNIEKLNCSHWEKSINKDLLKQSIPNIFALTNNKNIQISCFMLENHYIISPFITPQDSDSVLLSPSPKRIKNRKLMYKYPFYDLIKTSENRNAMKIARDCKIKDEVLLFGYPTKASNAPPLPEMDKEGKPKDIGRNILMKQTIQELKNIIFNDNFLVIAKGIIQNKTQENGKEFYLISGVADSGMVGGPYVLAKYPNQICGIYIEDHQSLLVHKVQKLTNEQFQQQIQATNIKGDL